VKLQKQTHKMLENKGFSTVGFDENGGLSQL
jgi:hypothetical protein